MLATLSASFIRLLNIRCNYFIAAAIGHDLGSQIYKQNIYQSYEEFIQTPNSQRIQSLTVQVSGTIAAVNLLLQLITSLVVASLVLAMLLITNFSLTLSLTLSLTAIYGLIFTRVAGHVSNKGSQILTTGERVLDIIQESAGSIKNVILDSSYDFYVKKFNLYDKKNRTASAEINFLSSFPRYFIESVALVIIVSLSCLFALSDDRKGNIFDSLILSSL